MPGFVLTVGLIAGHVMFLYKHISKPFGFLFLNSYVAERTFWFPLSVQLGSFLCVIKFMALC